MNNNIIKKAQEFAKLKHKGQLDTDNKDYYKAHLEVVGNIIQLITDDENIIASAYLHDTLEDTDTTYKELVKTFNETIAEYVYEMTHRGDKDKGYYFPNLKSKNAILIKFADRLSNLSRMNNWNEERQNQYIRKSKFWKTNIDDKISMGQTKNNKDE
jgi:(p)ppGpp synthase/HD superfamily hydrolase